MDTTEICELTEEAVVNLLNARQAGRAQPGGNGRRETPRWPFPATVQLWVTDEDGIEQHVLATGLNMSRGGIGVLCDEPLPVGLTLPIAVHQPEMSFHGRGTIRHCTETDVGYYLGLKFVFENR